MIRGLTCLLTFHVLDDFGLSQGKLLFIGIIPLSLKGLGHHVEQNFLAINVCNDNSIVTWKLSKEQTEGFETIVECSHGVIVFFQTTNVLLLGIASIRWDVTFLECLKRIIEPGHSTIVPSRSDIPIVACSSLGEPPKYIHT